MGGGNNDTTIMTRGVQKKEKRIRMEQNEKKSKTEDKIEKIVRKELKPYREENNINSN